MRNHVPKSRMADGLTTLRSVRNDVEHESGSYGLAPVEFSAYNKAAAGEHQKNGGTDVRSHSEPQNANDVLQLLRSRPDLHSLLALLRKLHSRSLDSDFSLNAPGPLQAQIVNTLLTVTVPDFWATLREQHASNLATCLLNVAGLNATFARFRLLSSQAPKTQAETQQVHDLLELVREVLKGTSVLLQLYDNLIAAVPAQVRRDLSWRELVTLFGSGKIPSTLAQAEDVVSKKHISFKGLDLTNANKYAEWLGRNIATLAIQQSDGSALAAAQVITKSLSMGYPDQLLQGFLLRFAKAWRENTNTVAVFSSVVQQLTASAKRMLLESLARWLSSITRTEHPDTVGPLAALLGLLVSKDGVLISSLASLLTDPRMSSLLSFPVRRAGILTLANLDIDVIQSTLEKLMSTFNDQLFLAHAPILQQECFAWNILLIAGYLHRQLPMALLMTARSSSHMQGVSTRLDSSNHRARWLGMIVGTAISSLVDKDGMKMSFGTDEMATDESKWYMGLVSSQDRVGDLLDLESLIDQPKSVVGTKTVINALPVINGKQTFGPPRPPAQTEVIGEKVSEVLDSDEDEDNDLKPYAKPDSDPEDSDEDATLVNRKKATPPVYIRDLMAMLRDDQSHDRFQLGIKHAAGLIRRKSNFGGEVKDHAEELGVILCNLHDPFETDDFDTLKLQAMIAVLLSDVKMMSPWFCRQAFVGDYSLAQRCVILSAVGLSGRELAGLKDDDDLNPTVNTSAFPSKRLPPQLHRIYSQGIDAASQNVEHTLIKPLALQAADKSTAHLNAVKVRTFASSDRTKRKVTPNELAKVFGPSYFFPLVNSYQQEIAAYGSSSVYASVPFVLVTFVKTLALLLHASGPATLSLSELSGDLWDLLLSLRTHASQDVTLLHAVLFGMLTVLELNQRIMAEHSKRLMETQQWVEIVFERVGSGEEKVRTLAAGVLVKTKEIIETYQKELMGVAMR